jgi:DNA topoisomerase-3
MGLSRSLLDGSARAGIRFLYRAFGEQPERHMLILCEKPSVAKEFARVLGCGGAKGYYQNKTITITYCIGHLFELCAPEAYNSAYKEWSLADLPIIPEQFRYKPIEAVKEQTAVVISLLKKHERGSILIATDAGREGELIAREALMQAGIRDISQCRRFWVSEALTAPVIQAGIKQALPLSAYNKTGAQGFARQRADWLVGMNLSRYLSIGTTDTFPVGRVQTAVLRAVADRNAETARFIAQPYYEMEAGIQSATGTVIKALLVNPFEKQGETRFPVPDKNAYLPEAQAFFRIERAVDKAESAAERKAGKPEKLLNITGLQKAAYKQFGYSPEKTLELAQSLYETHKCLSYPRTPSRVMGDNNADLFREKFELLKKAYPEYSASCDPALITGRNKHIFNSAALEDHHALIPLTLLPAAAGAGEKNVYEIALKSFFMVCMPDYIYDEKQIRFFCGKYTFKAAIRSVVQEGWKAVFGKSGEEEEVQEVAAFDESRCTVVKTETLSKKTRAPKEYTVDTLLSFMENPHKKGGEKLSGLGTPATRAEIIKKLFDRGYLKDAGKKLQAADKGRYLLKELEKDETLSAIADVSQTTAWERELEEDPAAFERSVTAYIRSCIKKDRMREAYQKAGIGKCPVCGREVLEYPKSYSCSGYKSEKPCRFSIWKEISGAKISAADAAALLSGKKAGVKKCVSIRTGKEFKARLYMNEKKEIAFEFAEGRKK